MDEPFETYIIERPESDPRDNTDWSVVSETPVRSHSPDWMNVESLRLYTKSEDIWFAWSASCSADIEASVAIDGAIVPESHCRTSTQAHVGYDWRHIRVTPGWLIVAIQMRGDGGIGPRTLRVTRRDPTSLIRGMGRRPGDLFGPVTPRRVTLPTMEAP